MRRAAMLEICSLDTGTEHQHFQLGSDCTSSDAGSTWVDAELYHSGNTNFNVFTVGSSKRLKAVGVGLGGTIVEFDLEINSVTPPSSLVSSGGFNIIDVLTGSAVATNILPSLSAQAHSKNAIATFTIPATARGKLYTAVSVSNSIITVNF